MSTELRDRFFELSTPDSPAADVAAYRAAVDAVDAEPVATVDGLAVCWHPTARFKALRFVDAERIDANVRDLFARPSEGAPELAAAFVDPTELSFRTFENIVALDRAFTGVPLGFDLIGRAELAPDAFTFTLDAPAAARERLDALDALNLYVPPLNASSRGGQRYIFHSALLADALTTAVKAAMPDLDGFSHVNPVFRCNRFEPGDADFHRHRDTPYYDAARNHVSRYTVLVYLTGGTGAPALDLGAGVALDTIGPYTCVVFDQRYEHAGAPYTDGRKVFLRTELVFEVSTVEHDPEIAALFSKACYWTGESVFAPELAAHADAYYNQVAAAHWAGLEPSDATEPFVHKEFRGVHFVANGYDFWFAKGDGLTLAECAAITLLDYFNCRLGDSAFRVQCKSERVAADGTAWIPEFLSGKRNRPAVLPFDKSHLFPEPEESDGTCCPFHAGMVSEAARLDEVIDFYASAQTFARAHIMPAPILMLGEDVVLDPEKFVVRGNQIHVTGDRELAPLNFAACWNSGGSVENYLDTAATVDAAHFLVPPILFTETADCYHLRFDFFRNSWMVRHDRATVPVPMIRDLREEPEDMPVDEQAPWLDAVMRATGDPGTLPTRSWWTRDKILGDFVGHIEERLYEIEEDED
ncbi:hypothetical protein GCM10009558_041900 [Virgisporangium aurantiacum]